LSGRSTSGGNEFQARVKKSQALKHMKNRYRPALTRVTVRATISCVKVGYEFGGFAWRASYPHRSLFSLCNMWQYFTCHVFSLNYKCCISQEYLKHIKLISVGLKEVGCTMSV
jgi:hypothetical protein